jgi:Peptidase family M23
MRFRHTIAMVAALLASHIASAATTYTVRPDPYPVGQDTWLNNSGHKVAEHDGRLEVGGWGDSYSIFLRFDLSGLPRTATQAKIFLYAYPHEDPRYNPVGIVLKDVNSQWQSRELSLATYPTTVGLMSMAPPIANSWYSINVTDLYNQWRSGNLSNLNFGIALTPVTTNATFSVFRGSGYPRDEYRPKLVITTDEVRSERIQLKWPLSTPRTTTVNSPFGDDWTANSTKCIGISKLHSGTDFPATALTTKIYAAEDGIIREVLAENTQWAGNVVLEHNGPNGKFTTTYWHLNAKGEALKYKNDTQKYPRFVAKGEQIGVVADLGTRTHFHFGVRVGAYERQWSGLGGIPSKSCTDANDGWDYPGFPAGFVNPLSSAVQWH